MYRTPRPDLPGPVPPGRYVVSPPARPPRARVALLALALALPAAGSALAADSPAGTTAPARAAAAAGASAGSTADGSSGSSAGTSDGVPSIAPPATWTETPFETLGDGHRVREGHVAARDAIEADALEAAAGRVVGRTPAHDALLGADRARPSSGHETPLHPGGRDGYHGATWIADVGVLLRRDDDGDRFFGAVELSIDVDTESVEREVYASVELTEPDGTLTIAHTTRTFTVRGNASGDVYRVEIELLDNHRAADRDVRIEVRDGWSGVLLDAVSPYELASLAALPLEAERPLHPIRDDDRHPDEESDYALGVLLGGSSHATGTYESDAYVAGYAGAAGPLGGVALLLVALRRRARRTGAASL